MTINIRNLSLCVLPALCFSAHADGLPEVLLKEAPKHFEVLVDHDHVAIVKPDSDERLIVLQDTGDTEDKGKRTLLIIKKNVPNNDWRILAKSKSAIPDNSCGGAFGDCFAGIDYVPKGFSINLYGGSIDRWSKKFLFIYSRRDQIWELVKAEEAGFRAGEKSSKLLYKEVYKPPRHFGKITISEFDPDDYLDRGAK